MTLNLPGGSTVLQLRALASTHPQFQPLEQGYERGPDSAPLFKDGFADSSPGTYIPWRPTPAASVSLDFPLGVIPDP